MICGDGAKRIYYEDDIFSALRHIIFDRGITHSPPLPRSRCVKRILVLSANIPPRESLEVKNLGQLSNMIFSLRVHVLHII
jgi:hypothetical protein